MRYLVSLFMTLFITSCSPASPPTSEAGAAKALNPEPLVIGAAQQQQLDATFATQVTPLSVRLVPAQPLVERPFSIRLQLPAGMRPSRSRIVGVSMYMGQIPVLWQQQDGHWHAEVMLGACSDPNMRWRLEIPLSNGEQQATLSVAFQTQQP